MKDILLTKEGDIKKRNGDFQFISGKEEVIQQIKQILKTNKGEWLNENYGIDYSAIQQKKINEDLIKDCIRDGISQCSEEITIESIEIGFKKELRLLYLEFRAYFSDGERYDNIIELNL